VKERRDEYIHALRRKHKQGIAGEIIATVKRRGGRFIQKVEVERLSTANGRLQTVTIWQEVHHHKTLLVKVKQLMRDVGPDAYQKRIMRREMRRQQELKPNPQQVLIPKTVGGAIGIVPSIAPAVATTTTTANGTTIIAPTITTTNSGGRTFGLPSVGTSSVVVTSNETPLHFHQNNLRASLPAALSFQQELQLLQELRLREELQQRLTLVSSLQFPQHALLGGDSGVSIHPLLLQPRVQLSSTMNHGNSSSLDRAQLLLQLQQQQQRQQEGRPPPQGPPSNAAVVMAAERLRLLPPPVARKKNHY
jgi:hypothetical protein